MSNKTLIEKKILNQLTAQEGVDFQQKLINNQSFAESYKIEADLYHYLKTKMENQDTRTYLNSLHNELKSEGLLPTKNSTSTEGKRIEVSFKKYWTYAAAAAMAAALFLVYFLTNSSISTQELYTQHYKTPEFTEVKRNIVDTKSFAVAYKNGDYKTAIQLLENKTISPKSNLYLGVCHLELNQTPQAISLFQSLQSEPAVNDQATWYLALCYLKSDDTVKCKYELIKLVTGEIQSPPFMREQAKGLLSKL